MKPLRFVLKYSVFPLIYKKALLNFLKNNKFCLYVSDFYFFLPMAILFSNPVLNLSMASKFSNPVLIIPVNLLPLVYKKALPAAFLKIIVNNFML